MTSLPPRVTALLERDLGADRVKLLEPTEDPPSEDARTIAVSLPRGFKLLVGWAADLEDRDVMRRRLELIVESFRELLSEAVAGIARPTAAQMLHVELRAIALAAGALDAVVIDAQSPVVWGAAEGDDTAPQIGGAVAEVIPIDPIERARAAKSSRPPPSPAELAIEAVRALPAMTTLPRGGHLGHHDREGTPPCVARSFAGIYVLVLVFEGPFDELRAERAIGDRIDGIERLVLSLPPIDPTPLDGAKAIRRPR